MMCCNFATTGSSVCRRRRVGVIEFRYFGGFCRSSASIDPAAPPFLLYFFLPTFDYREADCRPTQ